MIKQRLLKKNQLAARLGLFTDEFDRLRTPLEAEGFPEPVVKADEFGPELWDVNAVDAWLDLRIPGHLRAAPPEIRGPGIDKDGDTSRRLESRAKDLVL